MRTWLALAMLVLCGCGGGSSDTSSGGRQFSAVADDDNHGYGWGYDAMGDSGLRLRYAPTLSAGTEGTSVGFYENGFADVETCAGMSAPAPFVIVVEIGALGLTRDGLQASDRYFSRPSLVVIDKRLSTYKHAVVHYLLDHTTGDPDVNHVSHLFLDCGAQCTALACG